MSGFINCLKKDRTEHYVRNGTGNYTDWKKHQGRDQYSRGNCENAVRFKHSFESIGCAQDFESEQGLNHSEYHYENKAEPVYGNFIGWEKQRRNCGQAENKVC